MDISINQNGWAVTRLEDISVRITKGGTPTTYGYSFQKSGINFLKVENISEGQVNLKSITDFIGKDAHEFQSKSQLSVNDILFSIAGTIGETCVIRGEYLPANTNQALAIIKGTDAAIIPKLLQLQLEAFVAKVKSKARGGAMNNVSLEDLKNLLVYIPPIPEQHRIVAKLEELFSSLDKGIESLKTAQLQLGIYRHAVLKQAFEGVFTKNWRIKNEYNLEGFLKELKKQKDTAIKAKLIKKDNYFEISESKNFIYKVPDNWLQLPWKTITSNNKYAMKRGPFGSSLKKEFFVEKGYTVYEQGHAINDDPYRDRYFITDAKYNEMKAFAVKPGDMIISCSGVTLGRICLLPRDCKPGIINQALLKIDLDEKIVLKKYFIMMFRSETFQRKIFQKSLGTAMSNMVGMQELKELVIPIPSIEEQEQIIQEIESRLSICDKIEESISTSLQQSEVLRQSILKKAFEGKLVSQDPNDEPSSLLLERIKAERETLRQAQVKNKLVKKVKEKTAKSKIK